MPVPVPIKGSKKIALISILAALCTAIQLTPRPPNVEFTSLFTFTIGSMFGSAAGILFGNFIMFVNGFFSPWGFAGFNMPFQMAGMGLVGLFGGFYRNFLDGANQPKVYVEVAVYGAVLTVLYDIITNFGVALSMMVSMPPILAVFTAFAYGIPFSAIHVATNVALFGIAFLPLIRSLNYIVPAVKGLG
ncbi:MAG: ECF transporter S component [Candidatus Bathyarchaeia archaeon]